MKKRSLFTAALVTAAAMLSSCGTSGYETYAAAYNKVTANGGLQADFELELEMDGEKAESTGVFKLDTSGGKNIIYYEMDVNGATITQFSDGAYIYTDSDGHKTKYALNSKPTASSDKKENQAKDEAADGSFDTQAFLSEFSSFLEAGKIKELGLLSPIEKAAVKEIKESGGTYTFSFSENLVKKYLQIMIENETGKSADDTISIDELKDFSYEAAVTDGIVTGTKYSGILKVKVPGRLMFSGEDANYDMDLLIKIKFVDPGSAVSIDLPSTDDYTLIE